MIDCKENEDGSFTIYWDENDPIESILNDWTPEDFIKVITNYAEESIAVKDYCKNKQGLNFKYKAVQQSNYEGYNQTEEEFFGEYTEETGGESQDSNITEATKEDWSDFWDESKDEEFWEDYNKFCEEQRNQSSSFF